MTGKLRMLSFAAAALLQAGISFAQTPLIGITEDDRVFRMADAATPTTITTPIPITGLTAGQVVAGADYRPTTGELFIMGYASGSGTAQLYLLNPSTGVATAVGASVVLSLGTGSIGFDFNPTVDRIRVVGANGKNYRLNPLTGAIAATDVDLNYATGDPNFGQAPSIGAAAYTNSYIGTETTTLYDYDETKNILVTQIPPNNGTLNTIGSSGIVVNTANRTVDMDICYNLAAGTNTAYIAANVATGINDNLYTINLTTGAATSLGTIGTGLPVKDIAVVIDRTLPAVTGNLIYGLTRTTRSLISFDSDNPSFIRSIMPITGVTAGYYIAGMDFRPATRTLYLLGYNNGTGAYQLYTADPATGAATIVPGTSTTTLSLDSSTIGFDFNPVVDRIRVTSANGNNYRLNPLDGSVAATDIALAYNAGDPNNGVKPNIGSVAYVNSYKGATVTTLLGLDDSLAALTVINPPNNGTLNTVASNILSLNLTDRTNDMDVYFDSTTMTNIGYLAANPAGTANDNLYTLNVATGALSAPMRIGGGMAIADIAVMLRYSGPPVSVPGIAGQTVALQVFPNPAKDRITVRFSAGQDAVTITDMYGRVLRKITANGKETSLPVADLAPGNYLISTVKEGAVTGTAQILKQ